MNLGAGVGRGGRGRPGRQLSDATKVQFNGNLLVGTATTAQLGLEPGDEFEIKLGRKQIKPIPLGAAEEEWETVRCAGGPRCMALLRAAEGENRLRSLLASGHAHHALSDPTLCGKRLAGGVVAAGAGVPRR
jgi:hypothetical protein